MTMPKISVLIPAYQRAKTLERCVRSALDSGYANLQVVISDNGSTDGTGEIARRLAASDTRVEVIIHEENRGPLPNWLSCLQRAEGEFIHWLWSDDWIESGAYGILVEAMRADDADMALCAANLTTADSVLRVMHRLPRMSLNDLLHLGVQGGSLFPVSPLCALLPIASVRQALSSDIPVLDNLHCRQRAIGPDALMILGALKNARAVAIVDDPLVNMFIHNESITVSGQSRDINAHYAWARVWWARKSGLPQVWSWRDRLRLLKNGNWRASVSSVL